jgi:hypothetical protein
MNCTGVLLASRYWLRVIGFAVIGAFGTSLVIRKIKLPNDQ